MLNVCKYFLKQRFSGLAINRSIPKNFFANSAKTVAIPSFESYKFLPGIIQYVDNLKIMTPSPIQQLCFTHFSAKLAENKRPLFLGGPTGSGKTLAFLLPILNKIKEEEIKFDEHGALPHRPSVIIISPSKELVNQTFKVAKDISHILKLKVEKVDSSANWKFTRIAIKEGIDVLVTNMNKLTRLLKEKRIFLTNLKFIVFDEADVFLESGEEAQLVSLMKMVYLNRDLEEKAQIMFVSATLTSSLKIFLETIFDQQVKFLLTTNTHFNLANLQHDFLPVRTQNKLMMLENELSKHKKGQQDFFFIVFCNSMSSVRAVTYFLVDRGFNCASLHSDMPIRLRAETYEKFKNKKINVLVCSDLAARGLDFTHLLGVVNFDFPKNTNDYIHRSGRAGRIGNLGFVISLYNDSDLPVIERLKESNEKGVPIELTHSSYALKKTAKGEITKSPEKGISKKSKLNVPANYLKFREKINEAHPLSSNALKTRTKSIGMKKKPNFTRRKIIDIKKSIKNQLKINQNSKRAVFLRRTIKNLHKNTLREKGKLASPKHLK